MPLDPINSAGVFLVSTLFDLYIFILLIRLVLAWERADYFNPTTQIVLKFTQFVIVPLRRILPTYAGIELSTIVVILILELLKFLLISLMVMGIPHVSGLFVLAIADALKSLCNIFFFAIIIQAILTWVQSGYSPVGKALQQFTYPVLKPFQRLIPPVSGLDLSPLPALIILQLIIILLLNPLMSMGARLAFG